MTQTEIPPNDLRPGLPPPQFRLSTMMLAVTMLCLLFATFAAIGSHGGLILILFVLAVLAHVAGNALGMRLRENGDTPLADDGLTPARMAGRRRRPTKGDFAPVTPLSHRRALGLIILILTCLGIVAGAALGGSWVARIGGEPTLVSVGFAILFCGAMGGFATFLMSSFLKVTIGAFLQARRESMTR